jgi:hypothetical protein
MKISIRGVEIEVENFSKAGYGAVRRVLELGLANKSYKNRDAIRNAFAKATERGVRANPSDLWHHVVYRLYTETAASFRRMADPFQSWKRASGEAFELFLVDYYNRLLAHRDVRLVALIGKKMQIEALKLLGIYGKVGDSKLDIAIIADYVRGQSPSLSNGHIVGGIHAKVSLAERVSDDVPASVEMMKKGWVSYLVTLDVKSFPLSDTMSEERAYINKGELGTPEDPTDKRQYIEEHGSFDACFSFNLRTIPSPPNTRSGKRIFVSSLNGSWDHLCDALLAASKTHS